MSGAGLASRGIHHVTAIAGDPQRNFDFYVGILGLRLVKRTVNFDDPTTYHLYYGDALGRPGTVLTFFAWPGGAAGRSGAGQVTAVAFRAPPASLDYWRTRLAGSGVEVAGSERLGRSVLALRDPDALRLELVADPALAGARPAASGDVPPEHALGGFHGVTVGTGRPGRTAALLDEVLGFRIEDEGGERVRLRSRTGSSAPGTAVEVDRSANLPRGQMGVGCVHHVAFRAADEDEQDAVRRMVAGRGLEVTPPIDRYYFRSIYFREPGGVLFEVATDGPGFAVDEAAEALGTGLRLPPWLEPRRSEIERTLPPLRLPDPAPPSG